MKVLFHTAYFSFHSQYGEEIKKEVEKRGGTFIFTPVASDIIHNHHHKVKLIETDCAEKYKDFDFTILPDEACRAIAGKGIYINHGIFLPQRCHFDGRHKYEMNFNNNADYFFMPSQEIADLYKTFFTINKPMRITGFPQLDYIHNKRANKIFNKNTPTIIYVPTGSWKSELNSEQIVDNINFEELGYKYNKLGHPSRNINTDSTDYLCNADIVISDYSSAGLHAIACNIPTILVDNPNWNQQNPDKDSICVKARDASVRVVNQTELLNAIKTYINDPIFLEEKRKEYSPMLSKYIGNSSKIFVDELENVLNSKE